MHVCRLTDKVRLTYSVLLLCEVSYTELNWRQVDEIVQLLGTNSTSRTAWFNCNILNIIRDVAALPC